MLYLEYLQTYIGSHDVYTILSGYGGGNIEA
jgi:hypothetical protein